MLAHRAAPAKRVSWGMKRADLLDNLAHVERHVRHVRDGERHLLRQREIVDELERHGRGDSQTAKNARDIEMAQSAHLNDRASPTCVAADNIRLAAQPLPSSLDR